VEDAVLPSTLRRLRAIVTDNLPGLAGATASVVSAVSVIIDDDDDEI